MEYDSDTSSLEGDVHCPSDHASSRAFTTIGQGFRAPHLADGRISLALENCGTVARDHLASERTFLAYLRTSLTFASAGVALAGLSTASHSRKTQGFATWTPLDSYVRPLAVAYIFLGLFVLFVAGTSRYFTIQTLLTQGQFSVTRFRVGLIALILAAMSALLFGVLLADRTERDDRSGISFFSQLRI
ncbi:hypothetical protein FB451DRAFT_1132077 [Mycena latifolia]|nr:hypothetical protein FB451DRAFT_1132077 [Mycena latifolia]